MPKKKGFLEIAREVEKGVTERPWDWEQCRGSLEDARFIAFARNVWPEVMEVIQTMRTQRSIAFKAWKVLQKLDSAARKEM